MPPKKDPETGLPSRYVPKSLSPEDRAKQLKSIKEKTDRPQVQSFKSKPSKWTLMAREYFEGTPTIDEIASKIKVDKKGLEEILEKGRGAYYSSGSRPNQTAESWAKARLYAVLFGSSRARKVDKNIIEKYNIPVLATGKGKGEGEATGKRKGEGGEPPILVNKTYPDTYPDAVIDVINKMSFNPDNVVVMGSMAIRSQLYASDFDLYEVVKGSSIEQIVLGFKKIVKSLVDTPGVYVGDIKAGNIKDWEVVDEEAYIQDGEVYDYDAEKSKSKLKQLYDENIVPKEIYELGMKLLVDKPSITQLREIIKNLRPNIIRWTTREVSVGHKKLPDGRTYTLEDAFKSPSLIKLDVIARVRDIFQEFSIIYDFRIRGRRINDYRMTPADAIERDIQYYSASKSWFKALKRLFSLTNYQFMTGIDKKKSLEIIEKINDILTSDIGILYQVSGDISAMIAVADTFPTANKKRYETEFDEFRERLSNVYSVSEYLKQEKSILSLLRNLSKKRSTKALISGLEELQSKIDTILNDATFERIKSSGLLSIIKKND